MNFPRTVILSMIVCCYAAMLPIPSWAQSPAAPEVPAALQVLPVFAVEFKTGSLWDKAKPAHEQAHFAAHSANLKLLRDQGRLLLGGRYADKGLLLVAATSADELRAFIEADPAVRNQIFVYELHPFNVFYPGCVGSPRKPC
jgi:uncharacterized protein YciI